MDHKVKASGVFNPVNAACNPKSGQTVTLLGAGSPATGTTNNSGAYNSIMSAKLSAGAYSVHTTVAGTMTGGYGSILICNQADSPSATITVP